MISKPASSDERPDETTPDELPDEGGTLTDFLAQFSDGYKFVINRLEPRKLIVNGQERNFSGHLRTVLHAPTLDEIAETWGGGLFEVRVMGPVKGHKGPKIICSKQFEIAGDPRLPEAKPTYMAPPPANDVPAPPLTNPSAVMERVWEQTLEEKRRLEDKVERERSRFARPGMQDGAVLQAIQQGHRDQLDTLKQQIERRDRELSELRQQIEAARTRPSPFESPEVLTALLGRGQSDADRLLDQHTAELKLERERHQREIDADRERHRHELQQCQRDLAAEREKRQEEAMRTAEQHKKDVQGERERHEREIQSDRERQQRELMAERERHQRDLERQQREVEFERERQQRQLDQHQREIGGETERRQRELEMERREEKQRLEVVERLHKAEIETLRNSQMQLLATKDEHIARLNEELQRVRATVHPSDALSDLERVGKVVSAVRDFVPGLAGEAPPSESSGWEKVLEHARPLVEKIADNLSRPPVVNVTPAAPSAALQAPAPLAPVRIVRPRVAPISRVVELPMEGPRRRVVQPDLRQRIATAPRPAAPQAPPPPPAVSAPPEPAPVSAQAATVMEGLSYLESAFSQNRPVEEVARESMQKFPTGALRPLVTSGPELVMSQIETLAPSSALASPGGKRYLRELIGALKPLVDSTS